MRKQKTMSKRVAGNVEKYKFKVRRNYIKARRKVSSSSAGELVRDSPVRLRLMMIVSLVAVAVFIVLYTTLTSASPKTESFERDDLLRGSASYSNVNLVDNGKAIELQNGEVGTWNEEGASPVQSLPSLNYSDAEIVYGPNDQIYVMSSINRQCNFSTFSVERQVWTDLRAAPVGCGQGVILHYDGDESMYFMPGGNAANPSNRIFRYSIANDTWTELASSPVPVTSISSGTMVTQGSRKYLYMFRGMSSPSFWRYDVAANNWQNMPSYPATGDVSWGISLVWDEAGSIYASAVRSGQFRKFDIASQTWSDLPTIPDSTNTRGSLIYRDGFISAVRLQTSTNKPMIHSYNIATGQWQRHDDGPSNTYYGFKLSVAYDGERYGYTMLGMSIRPMMYRFDFLNNSWDVDSLTPSGLDNSHYHQQIIYDDDKYLYYTGSHTNAEWGDRLYRYDTVSDEVVQIGAQFNTQGGFKGVYHSRSIYFISYGRTEFIRFNLETSTFESLADISLTIANGANLVDGGDGFLYLVYGNGRTNFARYNIAANSWTTLASSPTSVNWGGGATRVGRFIYVSSGSNSGTFMRYNMDNGVWQTITRLPNAVHWSHFMTSDGNRYIYAGMSGRTEDSNKLVYRYDTQEDEWLRLADLPSDARIHASAAFDKASDTLMVSQGRDSPALWRWNPVADNYIKSGSWYSETYDLTQVQTWTSFQYDKQGEGEAKLYTRTSSNGKIWNEWREVNGNSIQSPTNRYFQFKIDLIGDGSSTPTVKDFKLSYTQESDSPMLPSQLTAKSSVASDALNLSTGQTHEYQHPYFKWQGADDGPGGSGVDGYYVYFGTNATADPEIDGSYQKQSDYTVSTPMTAGEVYYLRLKVKDNLGNVSSAATFFSYRYFYISPPENVIKSSSLDFSKGINNGVSIDDDGMKLLSSDLGTWSTGPVSMPPENTIGSAMTPVDDYIYVARGSGSNTFWRYSPANQSWTDLAPIPGAVTTGSSLAYDDSGTLYLMAGGNSSNFYTYDIEDDIWTTAKNLPSRAQGGSSINYIGDGRFSILFTGVREFYMYSASQDEFTPLSSYPTTISSSGSGTWYDGGDRLYAYFGAWSWDVLARNVMAVYNISTDTWEILADPPVVSYYVTGNLVSDGRGNLYTFTSMAYTNTSKNQRMMRYNIATNSWFEVRGLQNEINYGTATSDNERYIYILPGGGSSNYRKMIRFDSWTERFSPSTMGIDTNDRLAFDISNGSQWMGSNATTAAYDGKRYVYTMTGAESSLSVNNFVRFDYKSGESQYLPSPPLIGVDGSMEYLDGYIYYLPAKSTGEFYRFDETKRQWLRMADTPGVIYRPGTSSLVAVDGSLFAVRGNNSNLYKFTPDSDKGSWSTMRSSPGGIQSGSMAYDKASSSIFMLAGSGSSRFYQYHVGTNSWSTLAALPETSSYGSTMVIHDGKIYIQRGNLSKTSYIYDIASNSWGPGVDAPDNFRYGAVAVKVEENKALYLTGHYSPAVWEFIFPTESTAYSGQAVHISEPIEAQGIFDYSDITAQVDLPDNTYVELWTRTSDDGQNWDGWEIATDIKHYESSLSGIIKSKAKQFTQIKVALESADNMHTPTVGSYSLGYYYDVDPPDNPTTLDAYSGSDRKSKLLSSNWYNHSKPLFDWPEPGESGGATDGPLGSNIGGYWVYVGTDPHASPRTQGVFVENTEYIPELDIPGIYYVRMQTQDITGNVDGSIYEPFVYRFDNNPPTNPSLITVTPSGFTTKNNFSFTWPNSYDAHSGVAGYCYFTGATSGAFSVETCQKGTSLEDISAAYRSGTNVFYVRSYDNAGNYAPSYTSVSYYYTTDPPGPVTNLRAIPPTSIQNLFAFAWDLPTIYSGDPSQIDYCYSINVLPSPANTVCTSDRFISSFKAATQQGTNVLYVVAKDEANNANWNNFATANFIANTVSPGIPLNLTVSDTSDRLTDRWSLALTWDEPTFAGNGIKDYVVERSIDGHAFTTVGNTSNRAYVDLDIVADTVYYYRVRAQDNVNNEGGASGSVSRAAQGYYAQPPEVVVPPVAITDFDQAKITWVTARPSSSFVYYGTSPSNLSQSVGAIDSISSHSHVLTGLQTSTTYYYRVQSFDERRSYNLDDSFSEIGSFRTSEAAQIEDVNVLDITADSAVVSWRTSIPTQSRISYGPTQSYGFVLDNDTDNFNTSHTVRLTGLSGGTTYNFKLSARTNLSSTLTSDDYTFTTIARPIVSNIQFQPVEDGPTAGVLVSWSTNVPTSSTVYYSAHGDRLEASTSELTTDHQIILSGLASNTDYEIVAEGRDQYGNVGSSVAQRWTSMLDTRPPDILDPLYNVTVTDSGRDKKAQLIVSWRTDEPATSQILYDKIDAKKLSLKSPLNAAPTTNHVVIVSGLNLADIYKLQIVSRDLDGNTTYGLETTVVTPDRDMSIFDNVLDLMVRLFRVF